MAKISELSAAVSEIKRCGEALIRLSENMADFLPNGDNPAASDQAHDETPAPAQPAITLESVRAVLVEKSRAGHTDAVRALLEKHGAQKLTEIDQAEYPALLAEAEVLGNE